MKKFLILILIGCLACQQNKKGDIFDADTTTESKITETIKICFLSTGPNVKRENRILRDSTILNLIIQGKKVTGIYCWLPAEKDSRRGTLKAQKNGNLIKGEYTFMQEGKQETQPIIIKLKDTMASISTNKNKQGEITMKVGKITCSN